MNCQTEIRLSVISAVSGLRVRLKEEIQAEEAEEALTDAPNRTENQLPDKADDDE